MDKINIACFGWRCWVALDIPIWVVDGQGAYMHGPVTTRTVKQVFKGGHYSVLEADYIIRIELKEMAAWAEKI